MKANLRILSGVGEKGPACFLLEVDGARILLDAGKGPDAEKLPPLELLREIGDVHGIVLSHGHKDHAGALGEVFSMLGKSMKEIPLFATAYTLRALNIREGIELPVRGTSSILGIPVETGRDGHAPGGVWIRFDIEGGFLYMGDSSPTSAVYGYDSPPSSRFVLFDASYERYDCPNSLEDPDWKELLSRDGVVFPVPAEGRALEFAYLFSQRNTEALRIDREVRKAMRRCVSEDTAYLRRGLKRDLEYISETAQESSVNNLSGWHVVSDGEASNGMAAQWVSEWEDKEYPTFVFTGYLGKGTPARRLVHSNRARWKRWNVHPTFSENLELLHSVGAKEAVPCFSEQPAVFQDLPIPFPPRIHGRGERIILS